MTDSSHVLEISGLALLLGSVAMALCSLWLDRSSGLALATKFPLAVRMIQNKPFMLVTVVLGGALLVLNARLAKAPLSLRPAVTPSVSISQPAPIKTTTVPSPVVVPDPPVAAPVAALTEPVTSKNSHPTTGAQAVPVTKPRQAAVEPKKYELEPAAREQGSNAAHKTTTFSSARCTRLLEKVGSGEPLSTVEKNELVSSCQ